MNRLNMYCVVTKSLIMCFLYASLACLSTFAHAETVSTGLGKVTHTQGHAVPSCRTVLHVSNDTQTHRWFRIPEGKNDINAIVITALVAGRDVSIVYDPQQTTGCGTEPGIIYVTLH